ncbi:MAG TPA: ATP-binding protein [Acidimicrobiia bacterium]|nr:ATP-binding protein [Acidimicrobiia bacterium]
MFKFRLASKLAMASIPIGLVALLAGGYIAWTFLQGAEVQEETSRASNVASEAMGALGTLWSEQHLINTLVLRPDQVDPGNLEAARLQSEGSISILARAVDDYASSARPSTKKTASRIESNMADLEAWLTEIRQVEQFNASSASGYNTATDLLFDIISQVSLNLPDRFKAQDLGAAEALAEAANVSFQQEQVVRTFIAQGEASQRQLVEAALNLREQEVRGWQERAAVSSETAAQELAALAAMEEAVTGRAATETVDINGFPADRNEVLIVAADRLAAQTSEAAETDAAQARDRALLVAAIVGFILLITAFGTVRIERSLVRRVRAVTDSARRVADVELPNLVSALRNPDEAHAASAASTAIRIKEAGADEVGDLARSFSALHGTLIDVAAQQMDILRKGVSEIFVTLARRNSSLVDRQLALIDKLESKEEDPETLAGYYRLDHLSTRMRRNAESLLVLAGAESPRMWEKPLEVGDVVRAALGEVDEYQRIDILALEPVRVSGHVVSDIAHLLSELLDNATQFSPPTERVRVAGLFDESGYLLTISDHGIGMSDDRIAELNQLLGHPPVLGLALEPTLGLYVVARLAARHGMRVRLAPGVPGTTVRITVPRTLLETSTATRTDEGGRLRNSPSTEVRPNSREMPRVSVPSRLATPEPRVRQPLTPSVQPAVPNPTHLPGRVVEPTPANGQRASTNSATPPPRPNPAPRRYDPNQELPTRVPGTSFQDDGAVPTSKASEIGPDGIKAALSAFQTGRDSAGKLGDAARSTPAAPANDPGVTE